MAEAKLALSLDDLIRKNQPSRRGGIRVSVPRAKVQLRNRKGAAAPAAAAGSGARQPTKLNERIASALGVQKPAIAKKTAPPTRAAARPAARPAPRAASRPVTRPAKVAAAATAFLDRDAPDVQPSTRAAPAGRAARGAPQGRWQHDLYVPDEGPVVTRAQRQAPPVSGTKLHISNLDYKVTDVDLEELFSVFGKLNKAAVDFDRTGRSKGSGEVVFVNSAHAKAALQKYNGILLDGCRMQIELAAEDGIPVKLSSGVRVTFPDGSRASLPAAGGGGRSGVQLPRGFQQGLRDALGGGGPGRGAGGASAPAFAGRGAGGGGGGGRGGAAGRGRLRSGVVRNARQQDADDNDMMID